MQTALSAPLAAQTACATADLSFARTFRGQFTLSQSTTLVVADYQITDLAHGWRLHHCPQIPLSHIHAATGQLIGLVLGIAVDGAGTLISDGHTLPETQTFEHFITHAGGRYVAISTQDSGAIYADPTGSMGVVYDASTRTVASTTLMCINRPLIDTPRFDHHAIRTGRGAYALGFTRDAHVRTVMPNHRLNLHDFTLTRFWPTADTHFPTDNPQDAIAIIGTRLSTIIGAIAKNHQTLLPLSGGRDSRNLAAAAKPHLADIQQSYTYVMNWQGQIDAEIAAQIAQTLGLEHHIHASYTSATDQRITLHRAARMRQRTAFRLAGGFVGDANNDVLDGLTRKQPKGVVLRGNVMEILKANHWKRGRVRDAKHPDGHDPDYATERLAILPRGGAKTIDTFRPDYLAWHATLPNSVKSLAYDFAFIESLLPGWQPKFYSYTRNFLINPFCDRTILAACISLPVARRQSNQYNDELLAYLAPELTDIPFTPDIKVARKSPDHKAASTAA